MGTKFWDGTAASTLPASVKAYVSAAIRSAADLRGFAVALGRS